MGVFIWVCPCRDQQHSCEHPILPHFLHMKLKIFAVIEKKKIGRGNRFFLQDWVLLSSLISKRITSGGWNRLNTDVATKCYLISSSHSQGRNTTNRRLRSTTVSRNYISTKILFGTLIRPDLALRKIRAI